MTSLTIAKLLKNNGCLTKLVRHAPAMATTVIHLRSETKPMERRSALSPASATALLEAGYSVHVERSPARAYDDDEFEAVGARMVPEGSWPNASKDHVILGLKELPGDGSVLPHAHIQFGHCYKKQHGWAEYLARFANGGGTLYDIEFLTDEAGCRVAAFGYWAGYAGAAIALIAWAHQLHRPGTPLGPVPLYDSASSLVDHVRGRVLAARGESGPHPNIIVIGALGRCGLGAADFCKAAGIPETSILKWDMAETSKGGPFKEVADSDIFINCVYVGSTMVPPFVTLESLSKPGRRLRVIADVSLDPNNANNPVPVYSSYTNFNEPTLPVPVGGDGPELTVVGIDHLPTLVAREASDEFSNLLLPSLLALNCRESEGVWTRAESLYQEKVKELP